MRRQSRFKLLKCVSNGVLCVLYDLQRNLERCKTRSRYVHVFAQRKVEDTAAFFLHSLPFRKIETLKALLCLRWGTLKQSQIKAKENKIILCRNFNQFFPPFDFLFSFFFVANSIGLMTTQQIWESESIILVWKYMAVNSLTVCSMFSLLMATLFLTKISFPFYLGGHPFSFSGVFEISPRDHDELGEQFRFR